MEAFTVDTIEKLFYKKIMLYNDLLYCFEEERKSLIRIDLKKLWGLSKEKDEICAQIKSIRQNMSVAVNLENEQDSFNLNLIMDLIPGKYMDKFKKLYLRILKLKGEIEILRKQNILYIDDSLEFLDEMISIITGETDSGYIYNDKCHFNKSGSRSFLAREV
ncbi:MAG: flagellar protein FlgN [Desulfobacteraceae bacterium]|nr:flagellar protein FlgN [Desulfobacteraceae bacterium]MDH3573228.1 flagellar protein FlgN [Desulfobacteraceae bacterium]MDH3720120.1 flagellar protein FlgN [Desulfobacteraceae bacterium]MDH3836184.1 flagellar protein FlgN [Desulfobacteraceae bacterium]MDH3873919.1 flagellar protein FlgN [Desulfobacteraceae bacterium]